MPDLSFERRIGVFVATITVNLQWALLSSFFGSFSLLFLSSSVPHRSKACPGWLETGSPARPLRHYVEIVDGLFLEERLSPSRDPRRLGSPRSAHHCYSAAG